MVRRFEDGALSVLNSFRINVERCLEVWANAFYGDFVAVPWIVQVACNLVQGECDIRLTVVGQLHYSNSSLLLVVVSLESIADSLL